MPTKKNTDVAEEPTLDLVGGGNVDEVLPVAPVVDVLETSVRVAVDKWVSGHARNSPISRNTAAWNHFVNGLPALIQGIIEEVKQA